MAEHSQASDLLPNEPIKRMVGPLARFLHVEAAGGIVLLGCTITALVLANSPWADAFEGFWKIEAGIEFGSFRFVHSLKHLINDGLMAIFFFVIGMEVKRELVTGELRELRKAALPVAAALGGMIVPAGIYLAMQAGQEGMRGWGIPMATDIAFVVGCMALLGSRVPRGLRVMLLSLAIADDIGAILVIAIGYTDKLHWTWLIVGVIGLGVIRLFARLGVRSFLVYTVVGIVVWFAFHESGVHATIAGVIVGLMTPARSYVSSGLFAEILGRAQQVVSGDWETESHRAEKVDRLQRATRETVPPLEFLEYKLHPWVSFVVMPVFALANAGVPLQLSDLASPVAIAVMLGLVVGKPVGILIFSWLCTSTGLGQLPQRVTWKSILGGGMLAGIGFTMALFIGGLAFETSEMAPLLDSAKIGILVGSAVSAALGMTLLWMTLPKADQPSAENRPA